MGIVCGVFQSMATNKEDQQALGLLLMFILIAPSVIGVSLGVGVIIRRLP